ncbi:MAG: hypothetical protein IKH82_02430 [Clostridiales bacterium]|nr:hypothetical protein [Clostridiales bacterium]
MEARSNSTFIKTFAAITVTAMLLVILLAGIFIILEADHDCEGEDICVSGVFDTYMEDNGRYLTLRDARLLPLTEE